MQGEYGQHFYSLANLSDIEHLGQKLGKGARANVKLVRDNKNKKLLALKTIDLSSSETKDADAWSLYREFTVHREQDHPNIVKVHDYKREEDKCSILMQLAARGDMKRYVDARGGVDEHEALHVAYQLLHALAHLHMHDVLHRDVKLDNVLLDDHEHVLLCDFGWVSPPGDKERHILCGTYEYMSPEVVRQEYYDTKTDMWSLGILLYELVHAATPFYHSDLSQLLHNIASNATYPLHAHLSADYKHLLRSLLSPNPSYRPSAQQLLASPIFDRIRHSYIHQSSAQNIYAPGGGSGYAGFPQYMLPELEAMRSYSPLGFEVDYNDRKEFTYENMDDYIEFDLDFGFSTAVDYLKEKGNQFMSLFGDAGMKSPSMERVQVIPVTANQYFFSPRLSPSKPLHEAHLPQQPRPPWRSPMAPLSPEKQRTVPHSTMQKPKVYNPSSLYPPPSETQFVPSPLFKSISKMHSQSNFQSTGIRLMPTTVTATTATNSFKESSSNDFSKIMARNQASGQQHGAPANQEAVDSVRKKLQLNWSPTKPPQPVEHTPHFDSSEFNTNFSSYTNY